MKKMLVCLIASIFMFNVAGSVCAKSVLTRSEKFKLEQRHSILKKNHAVSKKSQLKSIQAKLKDENKAKKKIRSQGGF